MGTKAKYRAAGRIAGGIVAAALVLAFAVPIASAADEFGSTGVSGVTASNVSAGITLPALNEDKDVPYIPAATAIPTAQVWLQSALQLRSQELSYLTSRVGGTKLVGADRVALNGLLSSTTTGINALSISSSTDANIGQIRADSSTMVLGYRVFAVVRSVVNTVIGLDSEVATVQADVGLESGIKAAIAANQQAHKSVGSATALDADLVAKLNSAGTLLSNAAASVDVLNAASYPASVSVISGAQTARGQAVALVTLANSDIAQIVRVLANPSLTSKLKGKAFRLPLVKSKR